MILFKLRYFSKCEHLYAAKLCIISHERGLKSASELFDRNAALYAHGTHFQTIHMPVKLFQF